MKKYFARIAVLFLISTFIYSMIVNMKPYGHDTPVKGRVIYYSIPHCYVPTLPSLSKTCNFFFNHVDYIEKDAADPDRDRYFFFSDNTCGGVARDAFDRTRCYPSRVLNKWFDIVGNFIPFPSHIWSALTNGGNISGLSGLSPEGNAPSMFTNKEVFER